VSQGVFSVSTKLGRRLACFPLASMVGCPSWGEQVVEKGGREEEKEETRNFLASSLNQVQEGLKLHS